MWRRPTCGGGPSALHSLAISFTAVGGFVAGGIGSIVGVPTMLAAAGVGIIVNSALRRSAIMRIREFSNQADLEAPGGVDTPDTQRDNTLAG